MQLIKLFFAFLQIGLFSIGGGYAALPLIQNQVMLNSWLTPEEFADVVAISQMTPGPISINAATFVGTRVAGIVGAAVATIGSILPSCIIMSVIAYMYNKYSTARRIRGAMEGLRYSVVGLIGSASVSIALLTFCDVNIVSQKLGYDYFVVAIVIISIILLKKTKINQIYVIISAGFLTAMLEILTKV